MKMWEKGESHRGWIDDEGNRQFTVTAYVDLYDIRLWDYLKWLVFHKTICKLLGRYNWILAKTNGWPDTQCFEMIWYRRTLRFRGKESEVDGSWSLKESDRTE